MKKICLIKKKMINFKFKIFAITMELQCNRKNKKKSQINQIFLDQAYFFIKQTGLVWFSSICLLTERTGTKMSETSQTRLS